ncbi:MAG: hypothetical protein ABW352_04810 [Polyangiales bacterium]
MRPLTHLLFASSALLGTAGCLPDFSPDPINSELDEATADGGSDGGGARSDGGSGSRDASGGTRDATSPSNDAMMAANDSGAQPGGGDDGGGEEPQPTGPCNLAGRYAITERFGMDGLGAKQIVQNWYYVDLKQNGNDLEFTNSFGCGAQVNGAFPFEVKMDDTAAWPAYAANPAYLGRKGTVEMTADGCSVKFDKDAIVRGGTVEYYRDLTKPLPKLAEQAAPDKPGWEDWDNDGKPGVTLKISGIAQGSLHAVMRNWTEYSGTVQEGATTLTMSLNWGQSRSTLSYEGSQLLTADAARDPDESKHVVEFGKLTNEQTSGDNEAICKNVRDLAPTITPNASKI